MLPYLRFDFNYWVYFLAFVFFIQCYQRAVEQSPEVGHVKYMYLGQLSSGVEAIQYYQKGIELMTKKFTEFQTAQVSIKINSLVIN